MMYYDLVIYGTVKNSSHFTARRYASTVLAVIMCLSVCLKSELYKDG